MHGLKLGVLLSMNRFAFLLTGLAAHGVIAVGDGVAQGIGDRGNLVVCIGVGDGAVAGQGDGVVHRDACSRASPYQLVSRKRKG